MKYVGYVPQDQLPVKAGDTVTISKGTIVHYRGTAKPAGRTYQIRIHHIICGVTLSAADQSYQQRHGRPIHDVNSRVRWPGSGGYWSEVDINDLPEAKQ